MESRNALTDAVVALEGILIISLWLLIRYIGVNPPRSSDLQRVSHEGRELRFQYSFFFWRDQVLAVRPRQGHWQLPVAAGLRLLGGSLQAGGSSAATAHLLHLDIKPENILLDGRFWAVVADFRQSKLMNREQNWIAASLGGRRVHLAPECLLGTGISDKSENA